MKTQRFTSLSTGYYIAVSLKDAPADWTGPFNTFEEMQEFAKDECSPSVYGWQVGHSGTASLLSCPIVPKVAQK